MKMGRKAIFFFQIVSDESADNYMAYISIAFDIKRMFFCLFVCFMEHSRLRDFGNDCIPSTLGP